MEKGFVEAIETASSTNNERNEDVIIPVELVDEEKDSMMDMTKKQ